MTDEATLPPRPCPSCGKREPNEDPRVRFLRGGTLNVCVCGAVFRGDVVVGRAALGGDHVKITPEGAPRRRFRYLGYGRFRLEKR
jgi:hypothetical protein